jgi:hypothetical protein
MTRSPSTTPSVAFRPVSFTATASGIRPRTSRSCISYLKNTPNPKSSISTKLSLRGNPKMLLSPAARGQGLRSQTLVGTAAISSRCTTSPTSTLLVRPLAARNIPPGPQKWNSRSGPGRAHPPRRFYCLFHGEDCAHQTRDCPETKATRDRMARAQPADNPRVVAHTYQHPPPPYLHRTTHTNTTRKYKSYLPHPHLHTSNNKTSTTPMPQSKKTSSISRIAESFI